MPGSISGTRAYWAAGQLRTQCIHSTAYDSCWTASEAMLLLRRELWRQLKDSDSPLANAFSMLTASDMMRVTFSLDGREERWWYRRQANSVCVPSSRDMSSLEKHNPGMTPRCFNQKIAANEDEKNMPSTAAKVIKRTPNDSDLLSIHRNAHLALLAIHGTFVAASKRLSRCALSATSVVIRLAYVSEWIFSLLVVLC